MKRATIVSMLVAGMVWIGRAGLPDPEYVPTLEFYVGSPTKSPAPPYRVASFRDSRSNSVDLAGRFRGLAISKVPYGTYRYILLPVGAKDRLQEIDGTIELNHSVKYWVTLQAPYPTPGDYGLMHIRGRLKPVPNRGEPTWIRLQNVLVDSMSQQTKVEADGSFDIPCGPYTGNFQLSVLQGTEVLHTREIRLLHAKPDWLEVNLPRSQSK